MLSMYSKEILFFFSFFLKIGLNAENQTQLRNKEKKIIQLEVGLV